MIGKTLDNYRIERLLGSGGMGDVYIALDTRLDRQVALKVLPDRIRSDAESLERFEQEAKVVASFNHPNIVTLYEVEECEGIRFVTMEYVTGKPLKDLLPRRGFPVQKLLDLALPLVDAVRAAHEAGITHRDLKPDNIMLNDEGRVKVLDFGLAKRTHAARRRRRKTDVPPPEAGPPKEITEEGVILGTAAYMSPEQAEGQDVDYRSDIFSLGVILYEMATGERPFRGDTSISLISSILKDRPRPITEVRRFLPVELWRIVRRCIEKDPLERYQATADLYLDLSGLQREVESGVPLITGMKEAARSPRGAWAIWLGVLAVGLVAGASLSWAWLLGRRGGGPPPTGQALGGSIAPLTSGPGPEVQPTLWPDGKAVVYTAMVEGRAHLFLQRLGGTTAIDLTPDSGSDNTTPAFSPDGERIAFRSERDGGGIFVMGATGESVKRLTEQGYHPAWSPDGKEIVYATEGPETPWGRRSVSSLWRVDVQTGKARKIFDGDAVQPRWSPDGSRIAYWGLPAPANSQRDIWTIPAEGGEPVAVTNDPAIDWNPVWSPDGRWLFFVSDRGGTMNVWRVAIDEKSGIPGGPPSPVTWAGPGFRGDLSIAADGKSLAYVESAVSMNIHRVAFDPATGQAGGSPAAVTQGGEIVSTFDIAPRGDRIVYTTLGAREDLHVCAMDGAGRRELTEDPARDRGPRWHADGDHILFYSDRGGDYEVWSVHSDGTGLERLAGVPPSIYPPRWSPDRSRFVACIEDRKAYAVFKGDDPASAGPGERIADPPAPATRFLPWSWSPDGRRIAAILEAAGGASLGISVYSVDDRTWEPWTESGSNPVFLPDGERILYEDRGKIWIFDPRSREFQAVLDLPSQAVMMFQLTPDGRWIYFVQSATESDIWLLTLPGP